MHPLTSAWAGLCLLALTLPAAGARPGFTIAREGRSDCVIVHAADATAPELTAVRELAAELRAVTGADLPVRALAADEEAPRRAILVGDGPAARRLFPSVPWDRLGEEEIVLQTRRGRLLLAGGRPRGTMYAVSRWLQDYAGVRWWTPWAAYRPQRPTLRVPALDRREHPAFESRDPFWYVAFDPVWAARNFSNSQSARLTPELGGAIEYRGFVHTFFPLVPPEEHFAAHPEWFSLIKGERKHHHAQLCLTQPALLDHVIGRVRQWLRESPHARIVSISQNDWYGACECEACRRIDEAEGSPAGTMLQFVNQVAAALESEFPQVAFDTLAYQYTRKPPRTIRPRANVIVRLCSIEANFREPLTHPSNASFADDLRGWSKICDRLYVWDYTTDFAHYVQPHPNYFVLGENLRFFRDHHVRGVFEQGAYQSHGSEMAELRAWVLAQLMWNPDQDERALIREFLAGYYGPAAAPYILRYLELMHEASAGFVLTCFSKTDTPFHRLPTLAAAERLWEQAEASAADPETRERVRTARLPLRYVWLSRWEALRKEAAESGLAWPLPEDRSAVAAAFAEVARGVEGRPWTRVTHLNESGLTVEQFLARSGGAAKGSAP